MSNSQNELVQSIENRDYSRLEELLKVDGAVKKRDSKGRPLIFIAAEIGDCKAGEILLDAGADIDATSLQNINSLQTAFALKNYNFVSMLISRGAKHDLKDQHGKTILHHSAALGLTDLAKVIIDREIILPLQDKGSLFPSDLAIENGHEEIAYDIFKATMKNLPHPKRVAKWLQTEILEFLNRFFKKFEMLANDPEIVTWPGKGFHLLELCLAYLPRNDFRIRIIKRLLDVVDLNYDPNHSLIGDDGKPVYVSDSYNCILLTLCHGHRGLQNSFEYEEIGLILERFPGADLTELLWLAFESNNFKVTNFLLDKRIHKNFSDQEKLKLFLTDSDSWENIWDKIDLDISYRDDFGNNLLHLSLKNGCQCQKRTRWLICKGINPDDKDPSGDTPLHIALQQDHALEISVLLSMGADPNLRDSKGLDCYAYSGRYEQELDNYSFCMPCVSLKALGQKKVNWLKNSLSKFNNSVQKNVSAAIKDWLNDFVFQVYHPKEIRPDRIWGVFILSLAAMKTFLQEDAQIPDIFPEGCDQNENKLQNAIVTYGMRMGRWVALSNSNEYHEKKAEKWQFCCWQQSLRKIFYKCAINNDLHAGCVRVETILKDDEDIKPGRLLLKNVRKEWLQKRISEFNSDPVSLSRGMSLVNDFVVRFYIEDRIPEISEQFSLIGILLESLKNEKIEKPKLVDNGGWQDDSLECLYFKILKIFKEISEYQPSECFRFSDSTGYYKGEETLAALNGWAYRLRNTGCGI